MRGLFNHSGLFESFTDAIAVYSLILENLIGGICKAEFVKEIGKKKFAERNLPKEICKRLKEKTTHYKVAFSYPA